MIKTGLFFGSFNPVHIGHLMIANYFHAFTELDEIWMVVTPQNPWKKNQKLIPIWHRVNMLKIATSASKWLKVSDFEKDMAQPFFTYQSLQYLRKNHKSNTFVLLIGGDNYSKFTEWKNYTEILQNHEVWAYPRNTEEIEITKTGIKLFKAPQFEISSQDIRKSIKNNKDIRYYLPNAVYDYIIENELYSPK